MVLVSNTFYRNLLLGAAVTALASCGQVKDWDLRNLSGGFNTSDAGSQATLSRPTPDNNGVISYPGYQVVVARNGDTATSIAQRLGISPGELARYNAVSPDTALTPGAVLALPNRVAEASGGTPTGGPVGAGANGTYAGDNAAGGQIDITSLANGAIDRASGDQGNGGAVAGNTLPAPQQSAPSQQVAPNGHQPLRHKVQRGETAYSIARLYNIPVRALADWNGLGPDLAVHPGQYLLIPLVDKSKTAAPAPAVVTQPGQQSPVAPPPSASKPLPKSTPPKANAPVALPASPDLSRDRTTASATQFIMPVNGKVIRGYSSKNQGIDIAASAGSPVMAAANGTVAAITKDTEQVPILVLRHSGDMLTVYANVDNITVKKGDTVKQGQTIAT
ncbi:LysM peptidoglycan-binding domain-containing protein, partial [Thioclava sp. BHET1]